jgi:hypothetical protein
MDQTKKTLKPIKSKPPEINTHNNLILNTINKEYGFNNSEEEVISVTDQLHHSFGESTLNIENNSPIDNLLDYIHGLFDNFSQEPTQEISNFIQNLDMKEEVKIPSKKRNFEIPHLRGSLKKKCSNEKCEFCQNSPNIEAEKFVTLKGKSTSCICGYPVRYYLENEDKWVSSSYLTKINRPKDIKRRK